MKKRGSVVRIFILLLLLILLILAGCTNNTGTDISATPSQATTLDKRTTYTPQTMQGTYRCWSYNVQGAGKSCTSPPIVLNADGTYTMSSEKGTYSITGDTIILSESKIRGPGKIIEDGNQIRFEYEYQGWIHTVTYLSNGEVPQAASFSSKKTKYVEVSLALHFPDTGDASMINVATLRLPHSNDSIAQSLVYASEKNVVQANFRKTITKAGVPVGAIYDIYVSNGFTEWKATTLDLRQATSDVTMNITATFEESNDSPTENQNSPVENQDSSQYDNTISSPSAENQDTAPSTSTTSSLPTGNGTPCNDNIPRYSQPGCVEQ